MSKKKKVFDRKLLELAKLVAIYFSSLGMSLNYTYFSSEFQHQYAYRLYAYKK